jgi:hypothetical protein
MNGAAEGVRSAPSKSDEAIYLTATTIVLDGG